MREKMRKELLKPEEGVLDLKQDPGAMVDIEFLVQYLVLLYSHKYAGLLKWTDNVRLLQALIETGAMDEYTAHILKHAYLIYRAAAHQLSLQEKAGQSPPRSIQPPAGKSHRNLAVLFLQLRNQHYSFVTYFPWFLQICNFPGPRLSPPDFSLKYFDINGLFILNADGTHNASMEIVMETVHEQTAGRLKKKTARLTTRLLQGKEPDFLKQHARILDDYFQQAFESSMVGPRMDISKNPYAIIALGGYGRQEQCIHSDVDLLFLFKKKVPAEAENLIQEMVYPLWDIGLDVGYATRSLKECISLAAADFEILTPLLDARFICGWSLIYSDLMNQMRQKIIGKKIPHHY